VNIVYLLIRELWAIGFPQAIGWEVDYPDSKGKLDLAIYPFPPDKPEDKGPKTAIEVKKWALSAYNEARQEQDIIEDLVKLPKFHTADQRCLLLFTFGSCESDVWSKVEDLVKNRAAEALRVHCSTASVSEVKRAGFQSHSAYFKDMGYLGISLVEVRTETESG